MSISIKTKKDIENMKIAGGKAASVLDMIEGERQRKTSR